MIVFTFCFNAVVNVVHVVVVVYVPRAAFAVRVVVGCDAVIVSSVVV